MEWDMAKFYIEVARNEVFREVPIKEERRLSDASLRSGIQEE